MYGIVIMKGMFITFEGIDGSGKTTQLEAATEYLSQTGNEPLVLREPGSTPVSEKIRSILLDNSLTMSPVAELMLYEAARAELVAEVIGPALENNKIVLCDRFYDSTTAYQGYGRGIAIEVIEKMNDLAVGKYHPDLTLIFDVDYDISLTRRKETLDRLESETKDFFFRVKEGFLKIAQNDPGRITVIDGNRGTEQIFNEVKDCLNRLLEI